jgi:hypothetical protein
MPGRRDRQRRWLAAGIVSAAVHIGVFLGLALTTPRGGMRAEPPVFEVSLERSHAVPPEPKVAANQRPAPSPLQVHQPPAVAPSAPSSGLAAPPPGPAPARPAAIANAPPAPPAPKLKLDCLHLGPTARKGGAASQDCEVQKLAKIPGSSRTDPVFATAANPAWDAEVAERMRKHQALPREQPNSIDCPNSNLGLGCTDEALIPLVKQKF